MEVLIIVLILIVLIYIIRSRLEKNKSHDLYKILDKDGSIQILDKDGLIATLYKDRTIDWVRNTSIYKMGRIKFISDMFEEEVIKLKQEMSCL